MQANEFEKQVQKQLEEFQLSPSASVWKKVEEQIREKKRRRFIFFFILPVALGLLGVSLFQFLNTGKKPSAALKKENSLVIDPNTLATETKKQPALQQEKEIDKSNTTFTEKISQGQKPGNSPGNNQQISILRHRGQVENTTTAKKTDEVIKLPGNNNFPVETNNKQSNQQLTKIAGDPGASTVINEDKKSDQPQILQAGEVPLVDKQINLVKTDTIQTAEIVATNDKEAMVKKKTGLTGVKWGIDISAGVTASHNGVFSMQKSLAADMTSSPVTGGNGNPAPIISPSPIRSGLSFSAGLAVEWQVSKRSRISSGLQYSYASYRIKAGTRTDTSIRVQSNYSSTQVDQVYRGAQQNNYTNSFHFVTIPLWYHWQINKGLKLPIQWNAGIDASYLIATNALVYDASYGGIYYRNKDAFTRMHFSLGTGLSFRLGEKNKKEWVIGPELSFDMSRLMKDNKNQYLLYGGMNVKLLFPKKKK